MEKQPDDVLSYRDDDGLLWVRAACGHFIYDGDENPERKVTLCPNCMMLGMMGTDILLTHPQQKDPEW